MYAWSTFSPPLASKYGISTSQAAFVFGVTIAVFTLSMIGAGRLLESVGPRLVSGLGAVLFGAGYIYASLFQGSYSGIVLGIGVISGLGIGFCYVCPLTTCLQWFPDRKGLVVGLTVAGFGSGAIVWSAVVEYFLANGVGIMALFRGIGITVTALLLSTALCLHLPASHKKENDKNYLPYSKVLPNGRFWILVVSMFVGTFGGLLVISNLKPMGLAMGISFGQAALATSLFSLGNTAGRILWGLWHDKLGTVTLPISLIALAGSLLTLLFAPALGTFLLSSVLIGFSSGACFVLYATELASWLRHQNVGRFYPLVFLSYGAAGISGPVLAGFPFDISGSFIPAILIASGMAFLTLLAGWLPSRTLLRQAIAP